MIKTLVVRGNMLLLLSILSVQLWGQNIPANYYKEAEGQKKAELKTALHHIIKSANVLSYGSGAGKTWSGFSQVDVNEDGYYVDMYSLNNVKVNGTSAGSGMNIEHSFAKSWWGGTKNQAYKDIQQLRPSNSGANSSKGSWPMAVVDGKKTYDNGSIKVGKSSSRSGGEISAWEPSDEYKGDFARIYMYMVTCYEDFDQLWKGNSVNQLDNNKYPVFEPWTVQLLLDWCRQDPVSDWEIQRNDKVYGIQGNRNPYVDYAELAEYVWGDKTEEAWYPGGSTDPAINSPRNNSLVDMGATAINKPISKVVNVRAYNLTEDLALSITGNGFSISTTKVTKEEASGGKDVTVTYSSAEAASVTGTLTLTSGDLTTVVTLNAVAVDGIPAMPAKNVNTTSFIACWTDVLGGQYDLHVFTDDGTTLLQGYPVKVEAAKGEYAVADLDPETDYYYQLSQGSILSNKVKVTTATPVPVLSVSLPDGDLDFVAIPGEQSKAKRVEVHAEYLKNNIEVSIEAPFEISLNNESWSTYLNLGKEGGEVIYVRMPVSDVTVRYEATLSLNVADIEEPEELDITGVVEMQKSFFEDFEKGKKGGYTFGQVECTMGEWTMDDAGLFGQANYDRFRGTQAVRMGKNKASGSYICTTEPRVKGIGSVSFYAGVSGTDAEATVEVSYSVDGNVTWVSVETFTIPKGTTPTQYFCNVNVSQPATIRFEKKSGGRFNIDDIVMGDYIPTSIDKEAALPAFEYYIRDGKIILAINAPNKVSVYTLEGVKVYDNLLPVGITKITLPKGNYVLRCGEENRKILVF